MASCPMPIKLKKQFHKTFVSKVILKSLFIKNVQVRLKLHNQEKTALGEKKPRKIKKSPVISNATLYPALGVCVRRPERVSEPPELVMAVSSTMWVLGIKLPRAVCARKHSHTSLHLQASFPLPPLFFPNVLEIKPGSHTC